MTTADPQFGCASVPDGPTPSNRELCFLPATELAAAIRAKTVSPVEVIDSLYARIHTVNPKINAFCTLTEEQARLAAKEAEAVVMRGDRLGALHGVPGDPQPFGKPACSR